MSNKFVISLERSGGFTGIPFSYSIESSRLSSDEFKSLNEILESIPFNNLPVSDNLVNPSPPDAFVYKFNVKTDEINKSFVFNDKNLPEQFRKLLIQINRLNRAGL